MEVQLRLRHRALNIFLFFFLYQNFIDMLDFIIVIHFNFTTFQSLDGQIVSNVEVVRKRAEEGFGIKTLGLLLSNTNPFPHVGDCTTNGR